MKDDEKVIPLFSGTPSRAKEDRQAPVDIDFDRELNKRLAAMKSKMGDSKKTGAEHKDKSSNSELFRRKKSALQVLSRRYLLSLLDREFGGRSPVEAKLKNAIINWFFAQICFAGMLFTAAPNISSPISLTRFEILTCFTCVLYCLHKMIGN